MGGIGALAHWQLPGSCDCATAVSLGHAVFLLLDAPTATYGWLLNDSGVYTQIETMLVDGAVADRNGPGGEEGRI